MFWALDPHCFMPCRGEALRLGNSVSRSAAMKSWSREGQWQVAALYSRVSVSTKLNFKHGQIKRRQ